ILMFITSFEEQNITYRSCSNLRIHLCLHDLLNFGKTGKTQCKRDQKNHSSQKKTENKFNGLMHGKRIQKNW
ncbi:hypothetical protein KTI62_13790, partial [Acinetobacter schindleri]|nr:hypothetical protein [Acinetobacter schindleri]